MGEKKERERRGRSTDADASDRRSKTGTMVRISVLNDALRNMVNAERKGKRQALIRPSSKVVVKFLQVMLKNGYINEFVLVDDHRFGKIVVTTSAGIMDHEEARRKKVGGKVLGFFY